jgi:hypothetical protein
MGGMFSKPKKANTKKYVERPGAALEKDLPSFTRSAKKATAARLAEIERVMPRATAQRKQASKIISSMLRGELPKDVQEQTMRSIAEFGGAGFNPATAGRAGGFQMAQGMVPRQFGLQSLQLQQQGLNTSMSWQQLADSFAYDPLEVSQFTGPSAQYGQAKAGAAAKDYANTQAANELYYNRMIGLGKAAVSIIGGSRIGEQMPNPFGGGGGGVPAGGGGGGVGSPSGGGGGGSDTFSAASKVFGGG